MSSAEGTPFVEFRAAGVAVAAARPEVDEETAVALMLEAAEMLHNGLALDGLDPHDTAAVVAALCADLVSSDPAAAVRARAEAVLAEPDGLHDPEAVAGSLLVSATILRL